MFDLFSLLMLSGHQENWTFLKKKKEKETTYNIYLLIACKGVHILTNTLL